MLNQKRLVDQLDNNPDSVEKVMNDFVFENFGKFLDDNVFCEDFNQLAKKRSLLKKKK